MSKKYICKVCGKEYDNRHRFLGHCSSHNRITKSRNLKKSAINTTLHICTFCGSKFDDFHVLGGHTSNCKSNPNYTIRLENIRKNNKNNKHRHSDETKEKLSKIRIAYLTEHPDKVPYRLNHSSKMSYPELIFKNALLSSNIIGWEYNYQIGLYAYDFAFIELKIDVEIDGSTHDQVKVKKIDERRDIFSKERGWYVLRFTAKRVKTDVIGCIKELQLVIKKIGAIADAGSSTTMGTSL